VIDKEDFKSLGRLILDGPICHTAYDIYKLLQRDNVDYARRIYQHDGDKVGKEYRSSIEKMIGCRLHGIKNCLGPFC
jgi:hypothetical protein